MSVKQKINILIAVIMVAGIGGGIFYVVASRILKPQVQEQQIETKEKISLSVEDGEKKNTYEVNFREGMTALDATKQATDGKVEMKGEGTMAYVTSISGRLASESQHEFWEFLVNGKQAEVGAGSYGVQRGDIIAWRINSY